MDINFQFLHERKFNLPFEPAKQYEKKQITIIHVLPTFFWGKFGDIV